MLKIRLQRVGRKHEPSFRLVLTDSKNSTKSGKFKEILGSYDPRKSVDSIDGERVKYWLSKGVQATGTIHNLLVSHKIIDAKKRNVLPKKTPPAVEVPVEKEPAQIPRVETESVPEPEIAPESTSEPVVEPIAEPAQEEVVQ